MSQSKYKQILAELKKQILGGKFDSSNPFPSEAAVAREKQTTRNTVHRAFIELRRLGLIEGESGVTSAARPAFCSLSFDFDTLLEGHPVCSTYGV